MWNISKNHSDVTKILIKSFKQIKDTYSKSKQDIEQTLGHFYYLAATDSKFDEVFFVVFIVSIIELYKMVKIWDIKFLRS